MHSRQLHVAVDARCLNVQHVRGMGKLLFELVRRSAETGAIQWSLLGDRPEWPMQAPIHPHVQTKVVDTRGFRFHAWEQWTLPRLAKALNVDVLHAPATSMPWWQPVPSIVTINDVIPWQKPDAGSFYRSRLLPAAYHRAAAILTISQTSFKDIVERWPELESRLRVVSPGVDSRYFDVSTGGEPLVVGDRVVDHPFLLYLGGSDPRKRLEWAIQVWQAAPSLSLVVCGLRPDEHAQVLRSIPAESHHRLHLAPFVSEEEMPRLYRRATAVLYPTLYEGFGLPVVEAHAVGTPVLFSDLGSLSELKGPHAIVLPVDDLSSWNRAVQQIVEKPTTLASRNEGREWASRFTWDAYVERIVNAYDRVAANKLSGQS